MPLDVYIVVPFDIIILLKASVHFLNENISSLAERIKDILDSLGPRNSSLSSVDMLLLVRFLIGDGHHILVA